MFIRMIIEKKYNEIEDFLNKKNSTDIKGFIKNEQDINSNVEKDFIKFHEYGYTVWHIVTVLKDLEMLKLLCKHTISYIYNEDKNDFSPLDRAKAKNGSREIADFLNPVNLLYFLLENHKSISLLELRLVIFEIIKSLNDDESIEQSWRNELKNILNKTLIINGKDIHPLQKIIKLLNYPVKVRDFIKTFYEYINISERQYSDLIDENKNNNDIIYFLDFYKYDLLKANAVDGLLTDKKFKVLFKNIEKETFADEINKYCEKILDFFCKQKNIDYFNEFWENSPEKVKQLFICNDREDTGRNIFAKACANGNINAIKLLAESSCFKNYFKDMVEEDLLEYEDDNQFSPLHLAAYSGDEQTFEYIWSKVSIEMQNKFKQDQEKCTNRNVFFTACYEEFFNPIKLFITHDTLKKYAQVSLDLKDEEELSPLEIILFSGNESIFDYLYKNINEDQKNVFINSFYSKEESMLHEILTVKNNGAIKILMSNISLKPLIKRHLFKIKHGENIRLKLLNYPNSNISDVDFAHLCEEKECYCEDLDFNQSSSFKKRKHSESSIKNGYEDEASKQQSSEVTGMTPVQLLLNFENKKNSFQRNLSANVFDTSNLDSLELEDEDSSTKPDQNRKKLRFSA